ncbi:MAG: DUF1207 domain-containing protein [Pirellulales bacterium]|nr:DUF1207 domain-containing protein [Pirellulales bacterium]
MNRRPQIVILIGLLAVAGRVRSLGAAPPEWQPYRGEQASPSLAPTGEGTTFSSVGVDSAASVVATPSAPWSTSQPVMFPQPVFEAPPDEPLCYVAPPGAGYFDPNVAAAPGGPEFWQWRLLPGGVIWQSYWAGGREPHISGVAFHDENSGADLLDVTLGGRAALLRYGTDGPGRPQGFELQIEGAGLPRLNLNHNWDLDACDYRFGAPLVYGRDQWQAKFSYYHLSSHMGDELAIRDMALAQRINFSRDALVLGLSYYPLPAWRWYAEADWAFHYDVAEPWAFQFGVDVAEPGPTGPAGVPFLAVNGHIREELDYGGDVVLQAGWLWRGHSTNVLRLGFHYFNGKSNQFEFFDNFEQQIGGGLWYDF